MSFRARMLHGEDLKETLDKYVSNGAGQMKIWIFNIRHGRRWKYSQKQ